MQKYIQQQILAVYKFVYFAEEQKMFREVLISSRKPAWPIRRNNNVQNDRESSSSMVTRNLIGRPIDIIMIVADSVKSTDVANYNALVLTVGVGHHVLPVTLHLLFYFIYGQLFSFLTIFISKVYKSSTVTTVNKKTYIYTCCILDLIVRRWLNSLSFCSSMMLICFLSAL